MRPWPAALAYAALLALPAAAQPAAQDPLERFADALRREAGEGKLAEALAIYQALAEDPTTPAGLRARARLRAAACLAQLGRKEEATAIYEELARRASEPARQRAQARAALEALRVGGELDLALRQDRAGNHAAAQQLYSRRLKRLPEDARGWLLRGISRYAAGDHEGAQDDLEHALGLKPRWSVALLWRARAAAAAGDDERAERDLDAAVTLRPMQPEGYLERGRWHASRQRFDLAQRDLDLALRRDPACHEARLELGRLHLARLDLEAARRELSAVARPRGAAPRAASAALLELGWLLEAEADPVLARLAAEERLATADGAEHEAPLAALRREATRAALRAAESSFRLALELDPSAIEAELGLLELRVTALEAARADAGHDAQGGAEQPLTATMPAASPGAPRPQGSPGAPRPAGAPDGRRPEEGPHAPRPAGAPGASRATGDLAGPSPGPAGPAIDGRGGATSRDEPGDTSGPAAFGGSGLEPSAALESLTRRLDGLSPCSLDEPEGEGWPLRCAERRPLREWRARALRLLARARALTHDVPGERAAWERLLALDAHDPAALAWRARGERDPTARALAAREARDAAQDEARAEGRWLARARIRSRRAQGRRLRAEERAALWACARAWSALPGDGEAFLLAARLTERAGRRDLALELSRRACAADPDAPSAWAYRGHLLGGVSPAPHASRDPSATAPAHLGPAHLDPAHLDPHGPRDPTHAKRDPSDPSDPRDSGAPPALRDPSGPAAQGVAQRDPAEAARCYDRALELALAQSAGALDASAVEALGGRAQLRLGAPDTRAAARADLLRIRDGVPQDLAPLDPWTLLTWRRALELLAELQASPQDEAERARTAAARERVTAAIAARARAELRRAEQAEAKLDYLGAIRAYERVLALDPDDAEAHRGRGQAHLRAGDLLLGALDLSRAAQLDPRQGQALLERVRHVSQVADLERVLHEATELVESLPEVPAAHLLRGLLTLARAELGRVGPTDLVQGIAALDRALTLDPRFVLARICRGSLEEELARRGGPEAPACAQRADRDFAAAEELYPAGWLAPARRAALAARAAARPELPARERAARRTRALEHLRRAVTRGLDLQAWLSRETAAAAALSGPELEALRRPR
ncbi:MAG: tetratricopeptide repeat protein [Planctomycetota bacterium]